MKVFCKRTYFRTNSNYFPINGKSYGESYVLWKKGKYYKANLPMDYEREVGIYYIVESEQETFYMPIKKNDFDKYFIDIEKLRDEKINLILNLSENKGDE